MEDDRAAAANTSEAQPAEGRSARLSYALLNLVSEVVTVTLCDGSSVEGVLAGMDSNEGLGLLLREARRMTPQAGDPDATLAAPRVSVTLNPADVILIEATCGFKTTAPPAGHVAHASPTQGEFQPWTGGAEHVEESLDDGNHREGSWNQFDANQRLGVKTSYREDIYTTALDKSKMSREQQQRAVEIERQINSRGSKGVQHDIERGRAFDGDEGAAFSDVQRAQAAAQAAAVMLGRPQNPAAPPEQLPAAPLQQPEDGSLSTEAAAEQDSRALNQWQAHPGTIARAFAAAVSRRFVDSLATQPAWPHAATAPSVEEDGGDFSSAQFTAITAVANEPPMKVTVGLPPPPAAPQGQAPGGSMSVEPSRPPPSFEQQQQQHGQQQGGRGRGGAGTRGGRRGGRGDDQQGDDFNSRGHGGGFQGFQRGGGGGANAPSHQPPQQQQQQQQPQAMPQQQQQMPHHMHHHSHHQHQQFAAPPPFANGGGQPQYSMGQPQHQHHQQGYPMPNAGGPGGPNPNAGQYQRRDGLGSPAPPTGPSGFGGRGGRGGYDGPMLPPRTGGMDSPGDGFAQMRHPGGQMPMPANPQQGFGYGYGVSTGDPNGYGGRPDSAGGSSLPSGNASPAPQADDQAGRGAGTRMRRGGGGRR